MTPYLFPAQVSPTNVLSAGQAASSEIVRSFNNIWLDILKSEGIYRALTNLGLAIALIGLALSLVQWGRQSMERGTVSLTELVAPIVAIVLLMPLGQTNTTLLASVTLDLRGIVNEVNTQVLSQTVNGLTLEAAYRTATVQGASAQLAATIAEQCRTQSTPEKVRVCVEQKRQQFSQYLRDVREANGDNDSSYWGLLEDYISQGIDFVGDTISGTLFADVGSYVLEGILQIVLIAFHIAFQWVMELAMILVALIAPIAVGASLFPTPAKPIFAWLSAFLGAGMAKLGLNIVSGLAATIAVTATDTLNPFILLLVFAIFAPTLSLIVGSGSAISLFIALSYVANRANVGLMKMTAQGVRKMSRLTISVLRALTRR